MALPVAAGLVLLQLNAQVQPHANVTRVGRSLPLFPKDFESESLQACTGSRSLSTWANSEHEHIDAMINKFRTALPEASFMLDDGSTSCMAAGDAEQAQGPRKVMSIAEAYEDEKCIEKADTMLRDFKPTYFEVAGSSKMAEHGSERDYLTIWPKEGVCSKESPCPVVLFFHGCGSYLPYLQYVRHDDSCYDDLKSVLVFPRLLRDIGNGEKETWTGDGTDVLDNFVLPVWERFVQENKDIIDEDRVVVMGESLGSGMALQAGFLYPNLFKAIVATGITDGSSCVSVDTFAPEALSWVEKAQQVDSDSSAVKLVALTFAEKEMGVEDRVDGILDLLSSTPVGKKADVHFRLFSGVGHIESILMAQNQWTGLYNSVWKGTFV